jgi:hypothetical protein
LQNKDGPRTMLVIPSMIVAARFNRHVCRAVSAVQGAVPSERKQNWYHFRRAVWYTSSGSMFSRRATYLKEQG